MEESQIMPECFAVQEEREDSDFFADISLS